MLSNHESRALDIIINIDMISKHHMLNLCKSGFDIDLTY